MTFLMMLLACSFLIADAFQLDPYMSSFDKFDLKTNVEKRRDDNYCERICKCPVGPPLEDIDKEDDGVSGVSKRRGKNVNLAYEKSNDDTAPSRAGSPYGPWQREDFDYPSTAVRNLFN
ncbi:uncharacterized protein LOC123657513 [Melitaea cinxia]|uniref:uncharacterized protein LOC123657513 n=1 Tax=Melitaea cinxia TaxID=113334 RepID=UPI001E274798|nr:uncharacterized protein LOC123657513 [Melitaea cinxia]